MPLLSIQRGPEERRQFHKQVAHLILSDDERAADLVYLLQAHLAREPQAAPETPEQLREWMMQENAQGILDGLYTSIVETDLFLRRRLAELGKRPTSFGMTLSDTSTAQRAEGDLYMAKLRSIATLLQQAEEPKAPRMLSEVLAGRIGKFHSGGKARLSEQAEGIFAEGMAEKRRQGIL